MVIDLSTNNGVVFFEDVDPTRTSGRVALYRVAPKLAKLAKLAKVAKVAKVAKLAKLAKLAKVAKVAKVEEPMVSLC